MCAAASTPATMLSFTRSARACARVQRTLADSVRWILATEGRISTRYWLAQCRSCTFAAWCAAAGRWPAAAGGALCKLATGDGDAAFLPRQGRDRALLRRPGPVAGARARRGDHARRRQHDGARRRTVLTWGRAAVRSSSPSKRVVDYNVKVRVKARWHRRRGHRQRQMSMNPFDRDRRRGGGAVEGKGVASEIVAVSCGVAQCQETLRTTMAISAVSRHPGRVWRRTAAVGGVKLLKHWWSRRSPTW